MGRAKTKAVLMVGGPKDGQVFCYPTPLPNNIVFQDLSRPSQGTYFRKPHSTEYVHADQHREA